MKPGMQFDPVCSSKSALGLGAIMEGGLTPTMGRVGWDNDDYIGLPYILLIQHEYSIAPIEKVLTHDKSKLSTLPRF